MVKVYAIHPCIRCMTLTCRKDYCNDCLRVIRKPPMARASPIAPHRWERDDNGKRMRI